MRRYTLIRDRRLVILRLGFLPLRGSGREVYEEREYLYTFRTTVHFQPRLNGHFITTYCPGKVDRISVEYIY